MLYDSLISALLAMSGWEVLAALLGIAYVILATRESPWCWPLAFFSTLIYTLLFWEGQLPMQALLNVYYMGMAVYGYLRWHRHGQADDVLPITSWSVRQQFWLILTGIILTLVMGFYLLETGASQSPYLDAGVTVFSVLNTWLMAQKVLQNWVYWIIIDSAAIVLYYQTGFYATIAMFVVYLILAIIGLIRWNHHFQQ